MFTFKETPIVNLLLAIIVIITLFSSQLTTNSQYTLLILGILLGATLNYFGFGFSGAWRQYFKGHSSQGIRAQIIMLLTASTLFFILIQWDAHDDYHGILRPIGVSIIVGAFIFGIGMQIAKNCASGSLRATGNLQGYSALTVVFMIIGATLAAFHINFWESLPRIAPISLFQDYALTGWLLQSAFLALIYRLLLGHENKRHPNNNPLWVPSSGIFRAAHPLLIAGILLALLNASIFLISERPWVISDAFPLWGIKLSDILHLGLEWAFWDFGITHADRLAANIWQDTTHLTTIGVMLGAFLVAISRKKSSIELGTTANPNKRQIMLNLLLSTVGGFIMGYGAVISYGCNIGAFFSGISSGSLHGWVWLIFAIMGNWAGIKLHDFLHHLVRSP